MKRRQRISYWPTRKINWVGASTVHATLKDFLSGDFDDNGIRMAKDFV